MKKINLLIFTLSMFLFISVPSICYAEEKEPSTEIKCTDEDGIAIEDGSTVKEEQILTCSLHLKDANSATLKESAEIKLKSLEYDEDTLSKDSAIIISDGNVVNIFCTVCKDFVYEPLYAG